MPCDGPALLRRMLEALERFHIGFGVGFAGLAVVLTGVKGFVPGPYWIRGKNLEKSCLRQYALDPFWWLH